jgi:putative FmdB family regulatory protein
MPIYEYLCGACGHRLDALQKVSEEPLLHCPTCGKPQLKRQLSAPRFRLKGSGWYETDFKNDKRRNISQSDSQEAKPADKPDKKDPREAAKPAAEASKSEPAAKKPDAGKAGDLA